MFIGCSASLSKADTLKLISPIIMRNSKSWPVFYFVSYSPSHSEATVDESAQQKSAHPVPVVLFGTLINSAHSLVSAKLVSG